MLTAREETTGWIKTLRLHKAGSSARAGHTEDPEIIDEETQIVDVISQVFLRLTGLQNLLADSVTFSPEMYAYLYRLPTLRTLRCRSVKVLYVPFDMAVDDLRIEELFIDPTSNRQGPQVPEAITRLAWGPRLRKLRLGATTPSIVDMLLGYPTRTLDNVEELAFAGTLAPAELFRLAAACPNVTSMEARPWYAQDETQVPSPPPSVAPRLSDFRGSIELARVHVPGRPIRKVVAHTAKASHWDKETLIHLTMGSVTLQGLELETLAWQDDGMNIIFELFPFLETLKLNFWGEGQVSICESFLRLID